jgi:hypothetical protein
MLEAKTLQQNIAAKVGLDSRLADRIKGETPEEMEADAKSILEMLPKQKAAPNSGATNPGDKASKDESHAERKARLLGQAPDIYSGGGINWGEKIPKE